MKTITVGITGASGSVYAQRLLAQLNENPEVARIDLVISQAGVRVVGEELGLKVTGTDARVVRELLGKDSDKVKVHSANDIGATVASGSYLSDAMIIVPCSMGTLAAIASGMSRDLVHRAADVMDQNQLFAFDHIPQVKRLAIKRREAEILDLHLDFAQRDVIMAMVILGGGFPAHPKREEHEQANYFQCVLHFSFSAQQKNIRRNRHKQDHADISIGVEKGHVQPRQIVGANQTMLMD